MDLEQTLLEAIHADPGDESAWHALADHLEEQGDARAELTRAWLALRRAPDGAGRRDLEAKVEGLLAQGVRPCVPVLTSSIGMELVLVPPGSFWMGSPKGEAESTEGEWPRRPVTITKPFYLGACPVTQGQYAKVTGTNPSHFAVGGRGGEAMSELRDTSSFPVELVSFHEAETFCALLSELPAEREAGRVYRLPSEAEWEYACRAAGTSTAPFHCGPAMSSAQANFDGGFPYGGAPRGPYLERTCPVGSYAPNALGLFDLHGQVWEWCADWHDEDYYAAGPRVDPPGPAQGTQKVVRGGAWFYRAVMCRSACRYNWEPASHGDIVGFRVAMTASRVS
jgi:uncharacterized protein (TIGR02996 family)